MDVILKLARRYVEVIKGWFSYRLSDNEVEGLMIIWRPLSLNYQNALSFPETMVGIVALIVQGTPISRPMAGSLWKWGLSDFNCSPPSSRPLSELMWFAPPHSRFPITASNANQRLPSSAVRILSNPFDGNCYDLLSLRTSECVLICKTAQWTK